MARRRSYFAKSNKGKAASVFFSNVAVASQKREKEAQAARKRSAREEEKVRRQEERKRERERKRAEKEEERARRQAAKELARQNKAIEKLQARVKLELESLGLYPADTVSSPLAQRLYEAGVTSSQVKNYVKLDLTKDCAFALLTTLLESKDCEDEELLESKDCEDEELLESKDYEDEELLESKDFLELANLVANTNPQTLESVRAMPLFQKIVSLQKAIESLDREKRLFSFDLKQLKEMAWSQGWSVDELKESGEFEEFCESRRVYEVELERRIKNASQATSA